MRRPASPPRRSRSAKRAIGGRARAAAIVAGAFMPTRGRSGRLDRARAHPDHAVAARGQRRIVGDERERRAASRRKIEHEVHDRAAGRLVEIAGRLVGDQQRRPRGKRAGQRHALLLAAGKLRRIMVEAVAEAHLLEFGARAIEGVAGAGELERRGDVLERGHGRDQVEGLEDDADARAAKPGERVLAQAAELDAVDLDLAFVGPLEAGHDHEQRRLAGAGGADDPDRLAFHDCQTDVAQDMHARGAPAEAEIDAAHRDCGKGHRGGSS